MRKGRREAGKREQRERRAGVMSANSLLLLLTGGYYSHTVIHFFEPLLCHPVTLQNCVNSCNCNWPSQCASNLIYGYRLYTPARLLIRPSTSKNFVGTTPGHRFGEYKSYLWFMQPNHPTDRRCCVDLCISVHFCWSACSRSACIYPVSFTYMTRARVICWTAHIADLGTNNRLPLQSILFNTYSTQ